MHVLFAFCPGAAVMNIPHRTCIYTALVLQHSNVHQMYSIRSPPVIVIIVCESSEESSSTNNHKLRGNKDLLSLFSLGFGLVV